MAYEITVEVLDGPFPAVSWQDAWGDALIGAALSSNAVDWRWHTHSWGVVLEIAFSDEADYYRWRPLPVVTGALDAVPDRFFVQRGWGGTSPEPESRKPNPLRGSGSAALPL